MKVAICICDGFIKHETNLKHSTIFMFESGQSVLYRICDDGTYLVHRPDKVQFGFPCSGLDFNQNFLDLEEFRNKRIEEIIQ